MAANSSTEIELTRRDIRVLLLHEYRLGHLASKAARNICQTMGEDTLSVHAAQHWFMRFLSGDFGLDDLPHPGRPSVIDVSILGQLIEDDPRLSTRKLADLLGCSHTTIESVLAGLGKTWKHGVLVPHDLTLEQCQRRVDTCMQLLSLKRDHR